MWLTSCTIARYSSGVYVARQIEERGRELEAQRKRLHDTVAANKLAFEKEQEIERGLQKEVEREKNHESELGMSRLPSVASIVF